MAQLNALNIYKSKTTETRFIPLPREVWRSASKCHCKYCKGREGFWDTLAVPDSGRTYMVHWPELQSGETPRDLILLSN